MELYFPLILDGATGTELQKRGYDGSVATEQWILEHPEALCELQNEYIRAGSQIVYAPTFGANRVKLEENGLFNKVDEYNHRLVEISKKNAAGRALVAGDISPSGKFLAPLGDVSFEELVDIYTEQAAALEDAGVDLFAVETMMTASDARAALLAVKSVSSKPVIVSFTCEADGRTLTGSDVTALAVIFEGMGADVFGLNCSVGPEDLLPQIRRIHEYTSLPLSIKPNAGKPRMVDGNTMYDCPPDVFTSLTGYFADAGADVFGGCCGTGPEHIAMLREKLTDFRQAPPDPERMKGKLPLSTVKQPFPMEPDIEITRVIPCDENLPEIAEELMDNDTLPLIAVAVRSADEVENLADCQYAFTKPLCVVTDDAEALEAALRVYQGRAMYDGNLPEKTLRRMAEKYGLVY